MSSRVARVAATFLTVAALAFPIAGGATGAAPTSPASVPIAAGQGFTCAVSSIGGVTCWGYNNDGQLGNGSSTPKSLTPVNVLGLVSGVAAVAAGGHHACALTTGGGVKCWGLNSSGQLGDGSTTDRRTPVDVVGMTTGVRAITAGYEHTCALTDSGAAKCWGSNRSRQLGNGPQSVSVIPPNSSTPVDVVGLTSGVTAISAAVQHTCAVANGQGAMCWGAELHGELGNGPQNTVNIRPLDVVGLTAGVRAVSAGSEDTCALTEAGGVSCWGANYEAQLGSGAISNESQSPVAVAGLASGISAVASGFDHSCALTISGGVKCWGHNWFGVLGDGSATDRSSPVDVVGLTSGVAAISAGFDHTCAVMSTGGVKCWGANDGGQLGNGSNTISHTPVDVLSSAGGGATLVWQAKVGSAGMNGTAMVAGVRGGGGSIGLKLSKVRASSTLSIALYKGTCASVGAVLLKLASIKATSTGTAARTSSLTVAQMRLIVAATTGTGKVSIRVGSGVTATCGVFARVSVKGPQAVVQAFYDWYLSRSGAFAKLPSRAELTPGFIRSLHGFNGPYDPIVCAQDVPDWAKAGPPAISGSSATVHVVESFSPSAAGVPVKLALGPAGWQISGIQCVSD
jgi:alpha-tubulin suppressor-like RCC1 family protein